MSTNETNTQDETKGKGTLFIGDRVEEPVTLEADVAQVLTQVLNQAELAAAGTIDLDSRDEETGKRIGDDIAESLYHFRKAIAGAEGYGFDRDDDGNVVITLPDEEA